MKVLKMDKPRRTYRNKRASKKTETKNKDGAKTSKRNRAVKINELPKPDNLLMHDSLNIDVDDTFDKLLRGNKESELKTCTNSRLSDVDVNINKEKEDVPEEKLDTFDISITNSLSIYKNSVKQPSLKSPTYSFLKVDSSSHQSRNTYSNMFNNDSDIKKVAASTPIRLKHTSCAKENLPCSSTCSNVAPCVKVTQNLECEELQQSDEPVQEQNQSMDISIIPCTPYAKEPWHRKVPSSTPFQLNDNVQNSYKVNSSTINRDSNDSLITEKEDGMAISYIECTPNESPANLVKSKQQNIESAEYDMEISFRDMVDSNLRKRGDNEGSMDSVILISSDSDENTDVSLASSIHEEDDIAKEDQMVSSCKTLDDDKLKCSPEVYNEPVLKTYSNQTITEDKSQSINLYEGDSSAMDTSSSLVSSTHYKSNTSEESLFIRNDTNKVSSTKSSNVSSEKSIQNKLMTSDESVVSEKKTPPSSSPLSSFEEPNESHTKDEESFNVESKLGTVPKSYSNQIITEDESQSIDSYEGDASMMDTNQYFASSTHYKTNTSEESHSIRNRTNEVSSSKSSNVSSEKSIHNELMTLDESVISGEKTPPSFEEPSAHHTKDEEPFNVGPKPGTILKSYSNQIITEDESQSIDSYEGDASMMDTNQYFASSTHYKTNTSEESHSIRNRTSKISSTKSSNVSSEKSIHNELMTLDESVISGEKTPPSFEEPSAHHTKDEEPFNVGPKPGTILKSYSNQTITEDKSQSMDSYEGDVSMTNTRPSLASSIHYKTDTSEESHSIRNRTNEVSSSKSSNVSSEKSIHNELMTLDESTVSGEKTLPSASEQPSGYNTKDEESFYVEPKPASNIYRRRHTCGKITVNLLNPRERVLQMCNQIAPLSFDDINDSVIKFVKKKIGEGVFSEVYNYEAKTKCVLKIMPIEGDKMINNEKQKSYKEILSELVVAKELSDLRKSSQNYTTTFSELKSVYCVYGKYPEKLLDLWHLYDEEKDSENDCPDFFDDDQLYVILQFVNGGQDMENFTFNNSQQALSAFYQVSAALAIAEETLTFEHRDLHWGNVLIKQVKSKKYVRFILNGKIIRVLSQGIEVCIIDFTFSRINYENRVIYNDLANDVTLFDGKGDYQFEIYRKMKNLLNDKWECFNPKTNVYWLHYLVDKMVNSIKYKNGKSRIHKECLNKLKCIECELLDCKNSCTCFLNFFNKN